MKIKPLAFLIALTFSSPVVAQEIVTIECGGREIADEILDVSNPDAVEVPQEILEKCGLRSGLTKVAGALEDGKFTISEDRDYLERRSFSRNGAAVMSYTPSTPGVLLNWRATRSDTSTSLFGTLSFMDSRITASRLNDETSVHEAFVGLRGFKAGLYQLNGMGRVVGLSKGFDVGVRFDDRLHAQSVDIATFGQAIQIKDASGRVVDAVKPGMPGLYDLAELAARYPGASQIVVDGQEYEVVTERKISTDAKTAWFVGGIERYDTKSGELVYEPYAAARRPFVMGSWLAGQATITTEGGVLELQGQPSETVRLFARASRDRHGSNAFLSASHYSQMAGSFSFSAGWSEARSYASAGWSKGLSGGASVSLGARADTEGNISYRAGVGIPLPVIDGARLSVSWTKSEYATREPETRVFAGVSIPFGRVTRGTPVENIFSSLSLSSEGKARLNGRIAGTRYAIDHSAEATSWSSETQMGRTSVDLLVTEKEGVLSKTISLSGGAFVDTSGISFALPGEEMAFVEVQAPEGVDVLVDRRKQATVGPSGVVVIKAPAEREVMISVDDGDSLVAVGNPSQKVRVKKNTKAEVVFFGEEMI